MFYLLFTFLLHSKLTILEDSLNISGGIDHKRGMSLTNWNTKYLVFSYLPYLLFIEQVRFCVRWLHYFLEEEKNSLYSLSDLIIRKEKSLLIIIICIPKCVLKMCLALLPIFFAPPLLHPDDPWWGSSQLAEEHWCRDRPRNTLKGRRIRRFNYMYRSWPLPKGILWWKTHHICDKSS